ncbi:MAG TPA: hypothetical protein VIM42_03965 [Clostridium sp.]
MLIEVLGSGGATITPKPLCNCDVCKKAHLVGIPEARLGPAVYIHEAGILFDTPEEISYMLSRSSISNLKACFYSHWHPDHTMGKRVFENNIDYRSSVKERIPYRTTDVYVPCFVRKSMESYLSIWQHLSIFDSWKIIKLHTIEENEKININNYTVITIQLAEDYVSGYIVEHIGKRVLILMDELFGWNPNIEGHFECIIMPIGFFSINPITYNRLWPEDHSLCKNEADFFKNMEILDKLNTDKVVFIHIEEVDGHDHETLKEFVSYYANGRDWQVSYDTMKIEI